MRKATSESCRISLSVSWDTGRIYRTDRGPGGPPPVLGPVDEAVMDGVPDDVLAGRVVLVVALDQLRPVAAAENVVDASVPLVEGSSVAAVQVAHALVEVGLRRLDEEVVVVAHQAADLHLPAVAALDAAEDVEEDDAVVVVYNDRRVVVPAGHDVVRGAGKDDAVGPSHAATVAAAEAVVRPRTSFDTRPARPRYVPG